MGGAIERIVEAVDKTGLTEVISIVRRFLRVLKYLYCSKRYESNRLIGKIR